MVSRIPRTGQNKVQENELWWDVGGKPREMLKTSHESKEGKESKSRKKLKLRNYCKEVRKVSHKVREGNK